MSDHLTDAEPMVLAGRYQLLERLGEGGMGVVWRCFDLDLEEPVAIKFLREDLASDPALRACFRREVKLARRVTHPNVARVFEFGRADELVFLTMEFILGRSLDRVLAREGPLPRERALALARSLCSGLAAAHTAGVVHGDIKPGNILVTQERGAVLTDFGIARALAEAQGRSEVMRGTLEYMAPEQFAGERISLRSDVYATGIVFFEMLTGKSPWRGLAEHEVLAAKRLAQEPDVRQLAPDLPGGWTELIVDCLRSDPAQRPQDARTLTYRLVALHMPGKPRARTEGPAASTAEDAAEGAAEAAAEVVEVRSPPSAPLAAGDWPRWIEVVPFAAAEGVPADAAAQVTSSLVDALTRVRGLRVVGSGTGSRGPTLERRTLVRGEVRPTDGGVAVGVTLSESDKNGLRMEFVVHRSLAALGALGFELAARVVAGIDPERTGTYLPPRRKLDPDTSSLHLRAREASAAMRLDEALKLYEAALARQPEHRILRLEHTLTRVKQVFSLLRETSPTEIAGLRAAVEAAVVEHGDLGEAHLASASVALARGDLVACAEAVRAALARAPNLAGAHVLLADLLLDIGRVPDATRRLEIALALDSRNILTWTAKARLLAYQGEWAEFHATVDGVLAELRHRSPHLPRLMLWHPDRAALERLAAVYADNLDGLAEPLCEVARAVVAFGLATDERRAIFERLAAHPGFPHPQQSRFLLELLCEMACALGDLERAREYLALADHHGLSDWFWIEECPLLAPLRGDPSFEPIRERVRANADAIAEAIWG